MMQLASRTDEHGTAPRGDTGGRAIGDLLRALGDGRLEHGDPRTRVASVSCDSRTVAPGALFVALPGTHADGAAFVRDARARGASAIALGDEVAVTLALDEDAALVRCAAPRRFLALAAAELAGRPSERLTVVGVTGTSGKTTTTYLLESIFRAAGYAPGVVGTIEYRYAGATSAAPLTTPGAAELQELLARMVAARVSHVAMEVSSHALAQDRVAGVEFDVGVFTNCSRDHLDYHGDMEDYFGAKARLFRELLPASRKSAGAVLNAEDARVAKLVAELRVPVTTFGSGGDVSCVDLRADMHGLAGTLDVAGERVRFASRLVGSLHLANVLAAAAAAHRLGIPGGAIREGIAALPAVPGRLEAVVAGQPFAVIVDYAHKPDALDRSLASLRELTQRRLIVVFGCGGDRDQGKRPLMGEIAGRRADLVIVTSDNPRTEDPAAILAAVEAGVRAVSRTPVAQEALGQTGHADGYVVVPERRAAIRLAIDEARDGDLVLITGKGHEDYQIVGTTKHHLDDREEARGALAARGFVARQ